MSNEMKTNLSSSKANTSIARWYAVQVASSCEKKVKATLEQRSVTLGVNNRIIEIEIPQTPGIKLKKEPPEIKEASEIKEAKKKKNFLTSTFDELKLVVWPNKQQLFSESLAVIIMVSFSAAAIASVSRFYGWAASQIFP